MTLIALAFAATAAWATPAGPAPRLSPGLGCAASIDPAFVRYVPPALPANGRNPLLLLIASDAKDGAGAGPVMPLKPAPSCFRTVPASARR